MDCRYDCLLVRGRLLLLTIIAWSRPRVCSHFVEELRKSTFWRHLGIIISIELPRGCSLAIVLTPHGGHVGQLNLDREMETEVGVERARDGRNNRPGTDRKTKDSVVYGVLGYCYGGRDRSRALLRRTIATDTT